jgi:hypothetical protein
MSEIVLNKFHGPRLVMLSIAVFVEFSNDCDMLDRGFAAIGLAGYATVLWVMVTCKHPPKIGAVVILSAAYAELTLGSTQATDLPMFFVVLCHAVAVPAMMLYAVHATTPFKGISPEKLGRYGAATVPVFEAMVFIFYFRDAVPAISCFFLFGLFIQRGYVRGAVHPGESLTESLSDIPPAYKESKNGFTF